MQGGCSEHRHRNPATVRGIRRRGKKSPALRTVIPATRLKDRPSAYRTFAQPPPPQAIRARAVSSPNQCHAADGEREGSAAAAVQRRLTDPGKRTISEKGVRQRPGTEEVVLKSCVERDCEHPAHGASHASPALKIAFAATMSEASCPLAIRREQKARDEKSRALTTSF
jgi:hypothetical protein